MLIGKIPWLLGTYAPRTYSDKKPLIGTPLMWYYHTTLRYDALPPTTDALLAAAGTGQYGTSYAPGQPPRKGIPVLYDACWDVGVALNGSAQALVVRLVDQRYHHPAIGGLIGAGRDIERTWRATFQNMLGDLVAKQGSRRLSEADIDPAARGSFGCRSS